MTPWGKAATWPGSLGNLARRFLALTGAGLTAYWSGCAAHPRCAASP